MLVLEMNPSLHHLRVDRLPTLLGHGLLLNVHHGVQGDGGGGGLVSLKLAHSSICHQPSLTEELLERCFTHWRPRVSMN